MSKPTLEQRRAKDAWKKSQGCSKEYVTLAKGLPALIMNSGLMQTMAFLHEKGTGKNPQRHCADLAQHLRVWINQRFPDVRDDFEGFMQDMMESDPRDFQKITSEAFAWLRWMRQMSAARLGEN